MGLFRPARTVTGPHGEYWELYVSKTALPAWREGKPGRFEDGTGDPRGDLLELPFMLVSAVWGMLVEPLLRFLVLLPVSFVRGRRSRAIRIEAVNGFPHREVYLWTTTDDGVERVLDEIVAGLAAGKFAQPEGAVYSGRET
jgi:hypothetical protein